MKPDSRVSILWQHGSIKKSPWSQSQNAVSQGVTLIHPQKPIKVLGGKEQANYTFGLWIADKKLMKLINRQ